MRFTWLVVFAAASTAMAPSFASALSTSPSVSDVSFRILFDFGDGSYVWSAARASYANSTNGTWDAIRRVAGALNISIDSGWFPCCGVGIFDIGGRGSPAGFVGIFLWNRTSLRWELTAEGLSSLVVRDGDALALYNAAFDSVSFDDRAPLATPLEPQPSPMFRGSALNQGVSNSSVPAGPRVLWDRDTGVKEIGSSPAVAYGHVFVNTIDKLIALDGRTGAVRWQNHQVRGFSSPAVFDGSVFASSSNGSVYRLNATNGDVQWSTRLLANTGFSGITSSPKVVFDWVYVGTFNESGGPGEVVSLWASNGTVRWRHETGSVHFSSPAYTDGTIFVGVMGFYNTSSQIFFDPPFGVLALDATTGATNWFFPTAESVAASPAIAGAHLIVPSKDGNVFSIQWGHGGPAWRASVAAGISSPAIFGGRIYVGGGLFGGEGRIAAVDLATGVEQWSFRANGPVQSSVTYADGTLLFATNTANGTVYALDAESRELRWQFTPNPAQYILASPVVANGVVYVASDNGHVYALADVAPDQAWILGPLGLVAAVGGVGTVAVVAAVVFLLRRRRLPRAP